MKFRFRRGLNLFVDQNVNGGPLQRTFPKNASDTNKFSLAATNTHLMGEFLVLEYGTPIASSETFHGGEPGILLTSQNKIQLDGINTTFNSTLTESNTGIVINDRINSDILRAKIDSIDVQDSEYDPDGDSEIDTETAVIDKLKKFVTDNEGSSGSTLGTGLYINNSLIVRKNISSMGTVKHVGVVESSGGDDLAEFRILADGEFLEYGKCYYQTDDGIKKTSKKFQPGIIGIASDTYGLVLGGSTLNTAPIGLTGMALAYINTKEKEPEIGDCLTSGLNGTLEIMTRDEIKEYPDMIIAKYIGKSTNKKLNNMPNISKLVNVENRFWVKII